MDWLSPLPSAFGNTLLHADPILKIKHKSNTFQTAIKRPGIMMIVK